MGYGIWGMGYGVWGMGMYMPGYMVPGVNGIYYSEYCVLLGVHDL
jgi:hypothetical protein